MEVFFLSSFLSVLCVSAVNNSGEGRSATGGAKSQGSDEGCFSRTGRSAFYHCASSNGLDAALTFGLGNRSSIVLASAASPLPLTRMLSGEPLTSVTSEA